MKGNLYTFSQHLANTIYFDCACTCLALICENFIYIAGYWQWREKDTHCTHFQIDWKLVLKNAKMRRVYIVPLVPDTFYIAFEFTAIAVADTDRIGLSFYELLWARALSARERRAHFVRALSLYCIVITVSCFELRATEREQKGCCFWFITKIYPTNEQNQS